ncbi:MAG: bifunctional nuclease family protein [Paramuribaculum sp.]|nr:bifunctional nuclease family protein [Paramuribaculum sp.]
MKSNSDRIRLKVVGISYSQIQSGAYALILAQVGGDYRIPVVIGAAEAQAIALKMESITPPRPMTHDLFVSFAHAFGVKLREVFIYRFEDGIFSSELTFTDGERTIAIDSRTSDAIAIAMRTGSPIFTTPEILEETGFIIEESASVSDEDEAAAANAPVFSENDDEADAEFDEPRIENYSVEELQRTLERLIQQENYEEAARVNEILKKKLNS